MPPSSRDIDDFFGVPPGADGGVLLRRWAWVEIAPARTDPLTGEEIAPATHGARCVGDPLSLLTATDAEIGEALTANATVRAAVRAAEPAPEPVARPVFDDAGRIVATELVAPEPPPPPPVTPPASYRALRSLAYLAEIGGTGSLRDAAGNQFDALWHARLGDPEPLASQDAAIEAIKARYRPDAPWRALGPSG